MHGILVHGISVVTCCGPIGVLNRSYKVRKKRFNIELDEVWDAKSTGLVNINI